MYTLMRHRAYWNFKEDLPFVCQLDFPGAASHYYDGAQSFFYYGNYSLFLAWIWYDSLIKIIYKIKLRAGVE